MWYVRYLGEISGIHVVDAGRVDMQKLATKFWICLKTMEFNDIGFPVDIDGVSLCCVLGGTEVTNPVDIIGEPSPAGNDSQSLIEFLFAVCDHQKGD